jgi:YVTN family beta-propeller protein
MNVLFRHTFLRTCLAWGAALAALWPAAVMAQNPLVTGKSITLPPLGAQQNVGSLPMNLILSPDGSFAISSDMGFRQSLWSIDTSTGQGVSHLDFPGGSGVPNPNNASPAANGLYYGLAIKDNGDGTSTIYASQGAIRKIAVITLDNSTGALTQTGSITSTTAGDFPAGLALFAQGGVIYLAVAMNDPGSGSNPFIPCALVIYNTATGAEVGRYTFPAPANFPFAVAALFDGSKIFVSGQRDGVIYVFNGANPAAPVLSSTVSTGSHPVSLLLNRFRSKLYVANAGSDTISILNTSDNTVASTVLLRPPGATTIAGATPTNLALSPDEKTLFVTLGDMNAVAEVDLGKNAVIGYIPTGWYPTGVAVTPLKKVLVSNAKGVLTRYPNPGHTLSSFNSNPQYSQNQIEGTVATIPLPAPKTLATYTLQVLQNNRITANTANPPNPLANIGLQAGKIKHVIYIVKENRTYDQVLGDLTDSNGLPLGNGAPGLTLFGANVTPNQHALAMRFVTLDNFYDCGEVSGDGWPWSTGSMANEYVIKNLPYNYSGRGRQYDFEGANNNLLTGGHPAKDPDGGTLSQFYPNGAPVIPDVGQAPGSHIWDTVQNAGLTYRNYGFFYSFGQARTNAPVIPDNYPASTGLQPAGHDLQGKSDWDYRRYDNDYPGSDASITYFNQLKATDPATAAKCLYSLTQYGKYNMPSRFSEWNREFQQMIALDPVNGTGVPNFMTVRFNHDHTQGLTTGKHTPRSEVADNDYAVGQLVDAVSKSPVWNSTAIFVIEDDCQDGPDHVDCHRSVCFVISPYIKANSVDHTFYNTDSVLKTMELLLGVPPMSQYDATANPILDWDTAPNNNAAFSATLPDQVIICEIAANFDPKSKISRIARLSSQMDFTHPDSADPTILNEILWKSVKGVDSALPAPRHSVLLPAQGQNRSSSPGSKHGKATKNTAVKPNRSRDDDD